MVSRAQFAPRCLVATIGIAVLLTACGCPPSYQFEGRALICNATGEDLESITVIMDGQEIHLSRTAQGQAWLKSFRLNQKLAFRWFTESGDEFGASEPLGELVPKFSRGDLWIDLLGPGSLRIRHCQLLDVTR